MLKIILTLDFTLIDVKIVSVYLSGNLIQKILLLGFLVSGRLPHASHTENGHDWQWTGQSDNAEF